MPILVVERNFAPFDDSRKALTFALNQHLIAPPPAMMNQMMASVTLAPIVKKRKKKKSEIETLMLAFADDPETLVQMEREKGQRRRMDLQRHPGPQLAKADKPHLAGYILYHFKRMDRHHREVLTGLLTEAAIPCGCKQPCCAGWRPTERWSQAVRDTCETLMLRADVTKEPGKKGLSSQPLLRQLLVELYFLGDGPTLMEIARRAKVNTITAARHRGWIHEYLAETENGAWMALDALFDQAGITGASP